MKKEKLRGRPRAIPDHLLPVARNLLDIGYGYKSATKILREEYDLHIHWTRMRDLAKGRGIHKDSRNIEGKFKN